MFKRFTILLSLLLATAAGAIKADVATGQWYQYPVFSDFTQIEETLEGIYYVSGGFLYYTDRKGTETRSYTPGTDLSDYTITMIRHNPEKNFLVVAYDNGNLDLLYPNGNRVNLPDIKDAGINVDKTVNDIKFFDSDIYVATAFGLVIYDSDTHAVRESGIYNRPVVCVDASEIGLLISMSDTLELRFAKPGQHINKLENLEQWYYQAGGASSTGYIQDIALLDKNRRYYAVKLWSCPTTLYAEEGTKYSMYSHKATTGKMTRFRRDKNGDVYFFTDTTPFKWFRFDENYMPAGGVTLPTLFNANLLSAYNGLTDLWAGDATGFGNYDLSDGNVTVKRDKSVPEDVICSGAIFNMFPARDGVFTCNMTRSLIHPIVAGQDFALKLKCDLINLDGSTENINPTTVSTPITSQTTSAQKSQGNYIFAPTTMIQDTTNPDILLFGTAGEGIYVVKNGVEIAKFDYKKSPFPNFWPGSLCANMKFDDAGNLWVVNTIDNTNVKYPALSVLPAQKISAGYENITFDDWITFDVSFGLTDWDSRINPIPGINLIIAIDRSMHIIGINTQGTIHDKTDDQQVLITSITDQDGKFFNEGFRCSIVDQNGAIWIGTTKGVITIPNPSTIFSPDFHINRIKVPRNDGTNLADYLLESDQVCAIAVDNANRKWCATNGSGLYLVSEDGTEILEHYTANNSPLPSNVVTAVYCDPNSNAVYVGTGAGLFVLGSTASPARADYSEAYAYPNPVTPDYSGWITIAGLMGDSMVKIVDSAMNTVAQVQSEGGTAVWDGCNMNGQRVRSGVYYVLASSGSEASSTGAVATKILVIN